MSVSKDMQIEPFIYLSHGEYWYGACRYVKDATNVLGTYTYSYPCIEEELTLTKWGAILKSRSLARKHRRERDNPKKSNDKPRVTGKAR